MDLKQSHRRGERNLSKVSETSEEGEKFFQPGAAGVWGKYNGQLLMCKLLRIQRVSLKAFETIQFLC